MTKDKVVSIADRFQEAPPVDVISHRYPDCRHEHFVVDEKLRTVACSDCREERLDPLECLITLAHQWRRWKREAEQLTQLRTDHRRLEREKWERSRDRHINANPGHSIDPGRTSHHQGGGCRICQRLEITAPRELRDEARADRRFDQEHLFTPETSA